MAKGNIENKRESGWDDFKDKTVDESLSIVYDQILQKSKEMCDWYWASIQSKKKSSLVARAFAVLFLVIGTLLPIISAAFEKAEYKLALTQIGVALLVLAGLLTLSDRIFGWSSGWMRYIQTVTSMQNLVSIYKMQWSNHLANKTEPLDRSDLKALFDMTIVLQNELIKLLSDETNKWVVEFNASITLLESTIKAQRDEAEKKLDAIRTSMTEKNKEETAKEEANEKANEFGSIQVNFSFKENKAVKLKLKLDDQESVEFLGYSWAVLRVKPGEHILSVVTISDPVEERKIIIVVKPSQTVHVPVSISN